MSRECVSYVTLLLQKGLHDEAFAYATDLARRREYCQALISFEQLLEKLPDVFEIKYNYALVLEKAGRYVEAEQRYRELFDVEPAYSKATIGYARMLEQRQQYTQAVQLLRHATVSSPENAQVAAALGNSLIMAGEPEAALLWYSVALVSCPHDRMLVSNFLYSLLMVTEISPQIVAAELHQMSACPQRSFQLAQAAKRLNCLDGNKVCMLHTTLAKNRQELPFSMKSQENGRIRIGYISADLYSHPVGYFLEGVLANHSRDRWEVYIFAPYAKRDSLTTRLKAAAEKWVVLDEDNREGMFLQIRDSRLDIAVDLAGHTGGNYLDLFARRLAPVQLTWGGYPGTTGIDTMDYIVADPVALPPEDEPFYTERPLRLPHGYVSIVPPADAPLPGPLPAATAGFITFGSFNTVQKLSSATLSLWGAVLRAVPDARLVLKAKGFDDPQVCSALIDKMGEHGVNPQRIVVQGFSPRKEIFDAYRQIDIALDPIPYQGGVTILEALWMGVPTLVLRGKRPPFIRHGESHLCNLGFGDWVAATEEAYVAQAVVWSKDIQGLASLRCGLRQQMISSPVCDTAGFTRNFEAALEHVWRKHSVVSPL